MEDLFRCSFFLGVHFHQLNVSGRSGVVGTGGGWGEGVRLPSLPGVDVFLTARGGLVMPPSTFLTFNAIGVLGERAAGGSGGLHNFVKLLCLFHGLLKGLWSVGLEG